LHRNSSNLPHLAAKRRISTAKPANETIFGCCAVVRKQSAAKSLINKNWRRIMDNDSTRSESWDPALWSIGTALGAAIFYLACLA
jgi:hypothetical protein